ncbi:MAG: hypothetical protein AAF497_26610, partial [Planctomycetota bacterium]
MKLCEIESGRVLACVAVLAIATTMTGAAFGQISSGTIPDNASQKRYGNGWECDLGYRNVQGACIAVLLPTNSYPNGRTYGQAWSCKRGFVETDGACIEIEIPENAYLNSYGDRWKCNRGYVSLNG